MNDTLTTLDIKKINPVTHHAIDERYWFYFSEQWDSTPGSWVLRFYDLTPGDPGTHAYDTSSVRSFEGDWDDVVNLANFIHQSPMPFPRTQA